MSFFFSLLLAADGLAPALANPLSLSFGHSSYAARLADWDQRSVAVTTIPDRWSDGSSLVAVFGPRKRQHRYAIAFEQSVSAVRLAHVGASALGAASLIDRCIAPTDLKPDYGDTFKLRFGSAQHRQDDRIDASESPSGEGRSDNRAAARNAATRNCRE
jgi:hypothetical protein